MSVSRPPDSRNYWRLLQAVKPGDQLWKFKYNLALDNDGRNAGVGFLSFHLQFPSH
jgi:hypothetical protein